MNKSTAPTFNYTTENTAGITKKNPVSVNPLTGEITILEQFYKKSLVYNSAEATLLNSIIAGKTITRISIYRVPKTTYKGMNEPLIREYIHIQKNSAMLEAELANLSDSVMDEQVADEEVSFGRIKSWFLSHFPKISVSKMKAEINDYKNKQPAIKAAEALGQKPTLLKTGTEG